VILKYEKNVTVSPFKYKLAAECILSGADIQTSTSMQVTARGSRPDGAVSGQDPFVLRLCALTPLAKLHHFFICAFLFSV
jgi:hypothetical protein